MKNNIRRSHGFTLIEWVVVIIILAIVALVAASKFIDLCTDAIVSTLGGMETAIQSAAPLIYSQKRRLLALNGWRPPRLILMLSILS
jgi:MSHA pilin protein MshA